MGATQSLLFFLAFLLPALIFSCPEGRSETLLLCPRVTLKVEDRPGKVPLHKISLSPLERALICGEQSLPEWRNLPWLQVKFHLKTALENRGYYQARFERGKEKQAEHLFAFTGPLTRISQVMVTGFPQETLMGPYRKLLGRVLTPALLDEAQGYIKQQLWRWGYPCTPFALTADPDQSTVTIKVGEVQQKKIISVTEDEVKGVGSEIFRRYWAFGLGDVFNGDLVELTSRRIMGDGILQSVRFSVDCQEEGVGLSQFSVPGKPRLITVGLGANNERYLILNLQWKNVRLGTSGSSLSFSLLASFKNQEFVTEGNWHPLGGPSRFALRPALEVSREEEKHFETLSSRLKGEAAYSWDSHPLGITVSGGPVLNSQFTQRGAGPVRTHFLSLNGNVTLMEHDFELNRTNPLKGSILNLSTALTDDRFLSPLSAYHFSLSGESLYNFRDYFPPLLILGVRGKIGTTLVPHRKERKESVPLMFRHFLGGVDDLRGFGRKVIPNDPEGALTSLYLGYEIRFADLVHEKFHPLAFMDTGWIGKNPLKLDPTLYWSPGLGFRYQSPIGSFRGMAAHGFVAKAPEGREKEILTGWQFFLSLGQEF